MPIKSNSAQVFSRLMPQPAAVGSIRNSAVLESARPRAQQSSERRKLWGVSQKRRADWLSDLAVAEDGYTPTVASLRFSGRDGLEPGLPECHAQGSCEKYIQLFSVCPFTDRCNFVPCKLHFCAGTR